jgi:hypothetical protein
MPAKAGIQFLANALGPRFRGDERKSLHRPSHYALNTLSHHSFMAESFFARYP